MHMITIPEQRPCWPIWNAVDADALARKLAALADEGQELVARCESEGRDLTESEAARFDALLAEGKRLDGLLELTDRTGSISLGRKTTPEGPTDRSGPRRQSVHLGEPDDKALSARLAWQQRVPFAGRKMVDLFGPAAHARDHNFSSFDEFLDVLVSGRHDPRLIRATGMNELTGSDGGFLCPVEYSSQLLDAALETEICRPRARVEPMNSSTKMIGTLTNSDNSTSAPFGGLSLQWMQETGSINVKQAKVHLVNLRAHKGAIIVPVSNELLGDGRSVQEQLSTALIQSVSWGIDAAFLDGNGAGKPLGVLRSPSLISVAKEGGQLADTIQYENCVNMFAKLHPSCMSQAVWIANSTCLPQMLLMTTGVGPQLYVPAMTQTPSGYSLLGKPVLFTEKTPTVGDKGDLLLVDLSQYIVGLRKEISIDVSGHLGFQTDETYLRVIVRCDGLAAWASAVTPLHGNAQSFAVVLDERA